MNLHLKGLRFKTSKFILDWSDIRKGKMIGYVSLIIACWDLLFATAVYQGTQILNIPHEHRLLPSGMNLVYGFGFFYVFLCVLSIWCGNVVVKRSKKLKSIYIYLCMSIYTIGNVAIAHIFGELSMASGILMAGAPILGWIVFNNKGVVLSAIIACATAIPLFLLAFFKVIPYAPIVDVSSNFHLNFSYNTVLLGIMLPHLAALLALAYISITHWKKREAHANHLAGTDSLTNVANRRQLFNFLHQEIKGINITAQPLSIIMLDLDRFKSINDNYGHITGDEVLNQTINVLKTCLCEQYLLGRFGGDEFVIILPNTNATLVEKVANRCITTIRNTPIETESGDFNVTASFGVTTLYEVTEPFELEAVCRELISKADDALYQAKQKGRDCMVIAA